MTAHSDFGKLIHLSIILANLAALGTTPACYTILMDDCINSFAALTQARIGENERIYCS